MNSLQLWTDAQNDTEMSYIKPRLVVLICIRLRLLKLIVFFKNLSVFDQYYTKEILSNKWQKVEMAKKLLYG